MKIPKFSILVANYNNGKYLMDAINSVLRQTYSDWEIVIVDDCSTDESQILYENLKTDARIRIFYNPQNMGCGYTKNRCVMEARGEWCGFLDPDDMLSSETLMIFSERILKMPQYGVFFSHMYVCDENMNVLYDDTYRVGSPEWKTFIHYQKGIPFYCFNKRVYLSTSGIHLTLPQSVDIDLYYKMSEVTQAYYINLPLYYYRNNPVSLTKNPARAVSTHLWVMLESLKRRGVAELEIQKEIEGFWQWRTEPIYQAMEILQDDRFYRFGQRIKRLKKFLKSIFR